MVTRLIHDGKPLDVVVVCANKYMRDDFWGDG